MCCQDDEVLDLPAAAIEALAHYRRLRERTGWDWGDEDLPEFFRLARFSRLGDLTDALAATGGDWPAAIRRVAGDTPPPGLVVLEVPAAGALVPRVGSPRLAVAGRPTTLDVVVDAAIAATVVVEGTPITVAAGGASVATVEVEGPTLTVAHAGHVLEVAGALEVRPAATLRVRSGAWSRWSVVDAAGGGWWPDGVPPKSDGAHRPYFHARDTTLTVPAGELTVTCTRGPEYATASVVTRGDAVVELEPERLVDPAAEGWHSADLHVHLNYSGDLVVTPEQARDMQHGEGLELMNLTAGNLGGAHVYDRALFEATVGQDLWASAGTVARASVEFRNDLLGHVHAVAPTAPPTRYQTGHPGSEHPYDWPPNAAACAELRGADAATTYAHPVFGGFGDGDDPYAPFLSPHRTVEARELVADAALGLVDAMEVVSCFDDRAGAELYHRLLGCGLRPAAVAGSDVFLSFAHGPGVASNPPGWLRTYADLRGAPVTAEAVRDAVRAGRTLATNGPFVSLSVDGTGPGSVVDARAGDLLEVSARVRGSGADEVVLVGPDGEIAAASDVVTARVRVDGPLWLAAIARGGPHPLDPDRPVFAHTSPVHVEVGGARVGRAADARWCLGLLDRLEEIVVAEGRFDPERREAQLADHREVLDRARAVYRALCE
ncbi:CehA/McbA family metallohydrolase [Actinomycetospora rhizophila]|uniref:CehA/McbA family metallohydrolase n=1 Tax=Actinomycetospora rhizophila TaxID=1416876 RepID=A0ABV9ZF27_9PSEU